jgi:hypothetical protein
VSTRPESMKLSYFVNREWFEQEVLEGRDAEWVHSLSFNLDDLDEELAERAAAIHDAIDADSFVRVEVHGTGINPRAEDPDADELAPRWDQMMDGPICARIGRLPELAKPSDDPALVVAAWEAWLDAYRSASPDALRSWVGRWHPEDEEAASEGKETWWKITLPYRVDDGQSEISRLITFDGLSDFDLFRRVRAAYARLQYAIRSSESNDAIVADQALGSGIAIDDETFVLRSKPKDRDELVDAYEEFAIRWSRVALAARSNRQRRKGEFDRLMREWAEEKGSDRLKLGIEDGFRMTAVYLEERIAAEFPGFFAWSERKPKKPWKSRVGPTETALLGRREVQETLDAAGAALRAEIVWMLEPPEEMRSASWDTYTWDPTVTGPAEAIIVDGWLGRYVLIGPVSSEEVPLPSGYTWDPVFGTRPPAASDFSPSDFAPGGEDDIPF